MKTQWKIGIAAGAATVLAIIILIVNCFPTIEYYQMGFPLSRTTGNVETGSVYQTGRYFMRPDMTFKTFLKTVHYERFYQVSVSTADKLEIGLVTYFQYYLRPHQLAVLHEKFDKYYRPILKSNALDALKNAAVYYTTREFIRERQRVEKELQEAVTTRLSGKCCEKDCGTSETMECRPDCKPYAECTKDDWGLFAYMPLFQMTRVTIPSILAQNFENALLLFEKNEEALLRQEGTVIRKETVQKVRVIDNMADVITQSASANATLIRKLANADGKLMVENARIEGLKSLYSQLNITNEDHKTAFDYLRTLKNKEQTQLAIDFQSYIAGNLGKV